MWLQLLNELQAYVKQYHTTGVTWNSSRKSANFDPSRISVGVSVTSAPSGAGGPPMPPPPPPPLNMADLLADTSSARSATGPSSDALFAEINKGGAITSHLKKVSDDQKTHKNPNLRAGAVVPAANQTSTAPTSANKSSSVSQQQQKTPVFELADKKWKVEFQQNRNDLVIDKTDMKHTVYIYQCRECTITVKGKVNSILIDSCYKVGLLFDDVLSTVEFINTKNAQMQVLGRVPTVAIEKTDGCQVYLSRNSLDTEIVSSKSSAMNILIPNENEDGDFHEEPIPEQYKTVIKGRKLITTPTETA
jgi:adenylyl cyclase-associated protein